MHQSTSTSKYLVVSSDSSSASSESPIQVDNTVAVRRKSNKKSIENAIYSHVRAIRALGRKKINTTEIAEALSLPVLVVNQAVTSLLKKGVKVSNG
jgi:predicted transcriptional regulator